MDAVISFLLYFTRANAVLLVLGGFYLLLLRKSTFYTLNRIYILVTITVTCCLPLIDAPFNLFSVLFSSSIEAMPEQVGIPLIPVTDKANSVAEKSIWVYWQFWIMLILAMGTLVQLFRFITQLTSLYLLSNNTKVQYYNDIKYYITSKKLSPFSFFRFICVNPEQYDKQELGEIITHEKVHAKQQHSVDILLLEVFRCVFWVNPFAHIIQKMARLNLEYLTDRQVLKMGYNLVHYQYTILKVASKKILPVIVSELKMSNLKKRITMMNDSKVSKAHLFRYSLIVPLIALLWFLAAPVQAQENNKKKKATAENQEVKVRVFGVKEGDSNGSININGEEPLIIVDGVEVVGELKLNPDEIESVSVLKDFATKEYGDKGKNGVIIITKKGSEGSDSNVDRVGASVFIEYEETEGVAIATTRTGDVYTSDDSTNSVYVTMIAAGESGSNDEESSILSDNPLIVIDGAISSADAMKSIPSQGIESISVLKGESATAQYGDKGKNGVIVIKTKKL